MDSIPKNIFIPRVSSFYDANELQTAKTLLFKEMDTIKSVNQITSNDFPKIVRHKSGENKNRLDVEDMHDAIIKLNQLNYVLPNFYAVDLTRLPSSMTSQIDIVELTEVSLSTAKQITIAKELIESNKMMLTEINNNLKQKNANQVSNDFPALIQNQALSVNSNPIHKEVTATYQPSTGNWAAQAANLRSAIGPDGSQIDLFSDRPMLTSGRRAIQGSRLSSKIKSVPRSVSVFVGRLDEATTEEELQDHLDEMGIPGAVCAKLIDKKGRNFKTAAFKVTADKSHVAALFDGLTWPENCTVREWFYLPRSDGAQTNNYGS